MYRAIDVVNVYRKSPTRPLIYTLLARNIKLFYSETVNGSLISIDDRIVAVDPDSLLVMRNGKCEDLLVEFVLLSGVHNWIKKPNNL